VEKIEHAKGNNEKAKQAGAFVAQLKRAMRQAGKTQSP
jgi:hypothetical protein